MWSVGVIGAQGALGQVISSEFERGNWRVIRLARRSGEGDFRYVDLDLPATIPQALEGLDLVVNTVPGATLPAELAVLQLGGVLLNVAAAPDASRRALYAEAPTSPKGRVALHGGCVPWV